MDTLDRVEQIDWLRQFAANLAEMNADAAAGEIVDYAVSKVGRADLDITLPTWFGCHDMMLLTEYVQEALA